MKITEKLAMTQVIRGLCCDEGTRLGGKALMTNADIVKYVYEKFAQGDASAILATFDGDIEFRLAEGHPYSPEGKPWIGAMRLRKTSF